MSTLPTYKNGPNKTALITGASSGIGRAFADVLAKKNHQLILVARDKIKLQAIADELYSIYSSRTWVIACDLATQEGPQSLYRQIQKINLPIDIFVNNAGVGIYGDFVKNKWEAEQAMLQLNVMSATHLTKLIVNDMVKRGCGKVLITSSTAAFNPGPMYAAYAASKSYLLFFSQALNSELAGSGVSVTALCPGATDTDFAKNAGLPTPRGRAIKRSSKPLDVAISAIRALDYNRPVHIPKFTNRCFLLLFKLLPQNFITALLRHIRKGRTS